jgi:recombinational DNA repair protein (RecF pathway)
MESNNIEKCVSCGRETGYSINDHIDSRKTYVEGAGQLCSECFKEVYNKVHKKDVDVDEKP